MKKSKLQEIKDNLSYASDLLQRVAINHEEVELEDLIKALSNVEYCRGILFEEEVKETIDGEENA